MLILFELIVLLSCVNCLSFTGDYTSNLRTNDSLCLNPPPLCTCNDDVYSCSLVNSQDKAVIKIYYNNEWIVFQCLNLSSFETAPDLTNYINITDIRISKCMLSNRNTLIKLTSKISKQVKDLSMSFTVKEKLTLNKTAFEGFSKLQHLKIQFNSFRSMQISNDVFEHLVNLKKLTLVSVQTPNGLFDPLKHLQILSIKSNQMKLEIDIFKNQRNLIELNFYCEMNCSMDPFIFANITNLEDLEIIGNFSMNPENVLKNNEKLKSFKLSFSFQRHQFTQKLLAQKNHLRYVDFNHNNLETLPIDIFKNLSNIDKIILSSNQLITLSNDLFMDQTMLSELDLGYNNLTELHDGLFETTKNIKILILTSNLLTNISRHVFVKLKKLEKLSIDKNKIIIIDDESFKNLKFLQNINLKYNQLSNNMKNEWIGSPNSLKIINLSHNNLSRLSTSFNFFYTVSNLKLNDETIDYNFKFDLSYNRFTHFNIIELLNLVFVTEKLQSGPRLLININHNPVICDCNAIELIQFLNQRLEPNHTYKAVDFNVNNLRCNEPKHLYYRLVSSLSTSELVCNITKDCPKGCLCSQRPSDSTLIFKCFNLDEIPTLPKYANLNLNSTELYAANNSIKSIEVWNMPDDIKLLDLRNNSLYFIDDNVIERFKTIDQLFLSGNRWICDCNAEKFMTFFNSFRSKIMDGDTMLCTDGRLFKELNPKDLCSKFPTTELLVVLLLFTLLFALFLIFYLIFKKEIKMWLYAHNCCLWWVSEAEADKDKIYDAFFIFSHFDDSFVTDLILDLELPPNSFKCCVHHRDWPAGEMIVTLALNSIRKSRRIIVVLSPKFLESRWATWEFRVSLIHAFNERRSRVLVIIYGDVSLIDDLDEDLKTYVKYNTYLDAEDRWFHEKLLYAMPHKEDPLKQEKKNKNKLKTRHSTSLMSIHSSIYENNNQLSISDSD